MEAKPYVESSSCFTWQRPSRAPTADLHLVVMSASRFTSARLPAVRDDRDELLLSSTRARVCTSPLRSCKVPGALLSRQRLYAVLSRSRRVESSRVELESSWRWQTNKQQATTGPPTVVAQNFNVNCVEIRVFVWDLPVMTTHVSQTADNVAVLCSEQGAAARKPLPQQN